MKREVKDSGIEWIGEIPKDWGISKAKHLFLIKNGATPNSGVLSYWDGEIPWVTPADYKTEDIYISNPKRSITENGLNSCGTSIVPEGSIIISNRAPIGHVGIAKYPLCTNQGCKSLIKNANIIEKFYYYFFSVMSEPLNILGRGTTFLELSNNDLSNFILPLPTKETQMIIVSYLDQKCSEIDRIIHAKVEQNELLKEYRQSVIYEAVTKGLDKNVPMKDSGVEWIGEIPQGWSVMKLSSQVLLINTKVEFSGQKYIGLENVESWTGRYFDTDCMDSTGISNTFQDEDILFGKLRPYLAKCILAQFCGICSSEFLVLRTQNASNKYLAYTMLSKSFVNLVDSSTYGTKMPRANWSFIGNIQICVPTIEEQKLIADYLDLKCSQIDQIISANNSTIEELKDYRQSVIFEVVTGKKDLTNS